MPYISAAEIEAEIQNHERLFLIAHFLRIEPLLGRANEEVRFFLKEHWSIEAFFALADTTFESAFRVAAQDALVDAALPYIHTVSQHQQFGALIASPIGLDLV